MLGSMLRKKNPEEENRPGQEKAREEMRVERTNKRIFSFSMFLLAGKKRHILTNVKCSRLTVDGAAC